MKGIVFTEFLEMVEDRFSPELADRIIESADLPSRWVPAPQSERTTILSTVTLHSLHR